MLQFSDYKNKLKDGPNDLLVIYAAGLFGKLTLEAFKEKNINVDYFCDSDSSKWNTEIDGIKVISPTKLKDLDNMKPGAILMHPMPKRDEIDPRIDYLSRDPRVMYWRQQRNGMWVRCAIFVHLFGKTRPIMDLT